MAHNVSTHLRAKRARRRLQVKVRKIKSDLARTQDDSARQKLIDRLRRIAPNAQVPA